MAIKENGIQNSFHLNGKLPSCNGEEDITKSGSESTEIEETQESQEDNGGRNRWFQNRRQVIVFIILIFGNFCSASCVALQAPFFPREAEKKGVTPAQYGFVFGVFQLAIFLTSPIYGKIMSRMTPKAILTLGIFVMGITSMLFGFLSYSPGGLTFVYLALAVRIVEGVGSAAFTTASAAIVASEFPGKEATTYGAIKTAFGIGVISGPTIGGALYELGGYTLPFEVVGILLLFCTLGAFCVLPPSENPENLSRISLTRFYYDFGIIVNAITIFVFYMCIGFNQVSLEPHLRKTLDSSAFITGMVFVASGGIYAISAPLWGWICDKGMNAKFNVLFGIAFACINYLLIVPAPFLHMELKMWIAFCSLMVFGLGNAGALISSFSDCIKRTLKRGYSNDITTLSLISAMYTGSAALGAFVGPVLGGYLIEAFGFLHASLLPHVSLISLFIITVIYMVYEKIQKDENMVTIPDEERSLLDKSSTTIQMESSFTQSAILTSSYG